MKKLLLTLALLSPLALAASNASGDDAAAVHARVMTLDAHLDTPIHFPRPGWSIMQRQDYFADRSQIDHPRMVEGGLDGGFWVIFTPQGPRTDEAHAAAFDRAMGTLINIRQMVARNHGHFELAMTADDAERIVAEGRRVVYISIENGYPLGREPRKLETFYRLGVRMFGPVHFANNELADSGTDPGGPEWGGLSPIGRELVQEANRLGIILDVSHASDDVFDQVLDLSEAPVVASHTSAKALYDHPRNLDDERMRRLAAAGGVLHMNAFSAYLVPTPMPEGRREAFRDLGQEYGDFYQLAGERLRAYMLQRAAIESDNPVPIATFEDFMAHLLHTLEVMGVDHVGIGADWDGGGGVEGMWDVTDIPRITAALLEAGYSEEDIAKIWSGNVLRVMREVEAVAARLKAEAGA
jgi:membrane dipeptidase